MKTGKTLMELAQEVDRQKKAKRDFIADSRTVQMIPVEGTARLNLHEIGQFEATENCHNQIAQRIGIPQAYYDRMLVDAPTLLANNVNHWFYNQPDKRMIRTLDGKARAFLSDRYRPLDNDDLLEAVLPVISEMQAEIVSCEVTESRLYLKVLTPKLEAEVKKGDVVQAGLVISNSEIGRGSLRVEPLIYRLICLNGMITDSAMRKYHVGRGFDVEDQIRELLTDSTKQKSDETFWLQVRDVVKASFRDDIFQGNVQKLIEATTEKMVKDPVKICEIIKKEYQLSDQHRASVLTHLIQGGDLSRYGLAQAITRTANDEESYDKATELERLGGKIIELPKSDWESISLN